jgi:hypothetical protein
MKTLKLPKGAPAPNKTICWQTDNRPDAKNPMAHCTKPKGHKKQGIPHTWEHA